MAAYKEINKWIAEAEQSIKEIEKLPEAERRKAQAEFLDLDPESKSGRLYFANLDAFSETSMRKFMGNK